MPMRNRDVVVVGASAGGVEALRAMAAGFPPDMPAAVLVVLHLPAGGTSVLPTILDRAGALPAAAATDGVELRPGRIYVAPPDHHLIVAEDRLRLSSGPTENGHRPAIDVLFRSAARALGPRVTGVVLSGVLDDGAAGLVAVASRGGATVVQDPEDALYRGMPDNALRLVRADHVLPAAKIGPALAELALEEVDVSAAPPVSDQLRLEVDMAALADRGRPDLLRHGGSAGMSCPDCGGNLVEMPDAGPRYRCHVGHAWSPDALLAEQSVTAERALWLAMRTLEEKGALARRMLGRVAQNAAAGSLRARYENTARECEDAAGVLRGMLLSGLPSSESPGP